MTPKSEWVWYGYAGHLCVGKQCAYHLCTRVGGFLVSTVGHYLPRGQDEMETIGIGDNAYFETMVFACDGDEPSGDPNVLSFSKLDCERYAKSIDAERGHRAMCEKYAAKLPMTVN